MEILACEMKQIIWRKTNERENKDWIVDTSFRFGLFLYGHHQVPSASTNCEYDYCIVEQGVELLQGEALGVTYGKT